MRRASSTARRIPALTAVVTGTVTGGDAVNYIAGDDRRSTLSGVGGYPIAVTLGIESELRRDQDRQHADGQQGRGDGGGRMRRASSTARRIPALTAVVTGAGDGRGRGRLQRWRRPRGDAVRPSAATRSTVTLGTNPNYDVTKTDSTLTVNKAVATVVADAKSKFYGAANPALTAVVTGHGDGRATTVDYTLATTAVDAVAPSGATRSTVTLGIESELRRDQDRQHC